jgi:formyltetrahydrofolate hydrolase
MALESTLAPMESGARRDADITRLLISCADRPGIVAAVSRFLLEAGANIVSSDQHTTDPRGGSFFMRMEFDLPMQPGRHAGFERRFATAVGEPVPVINIHHSFLPAFSGAVKWHCEDRVLLHDNTTIVF